jgi:hypothetical protein
VPPRSRQLRKWRRRGRRGQVAAVATIFGLLLVVVFIANYLTTTLPAQMSVNDLDHVIQVENQVGQLQALLEAASSANAVGAELTSPITLGAQGQPPFASADSGSIGPAANGSYFQVNSTLSGPLTYTPPTGGVAGTGYDVPSNGCTVTGTAVTCSGSNRFQWNFSATATNFAFHTTAGSYLINVTDSGASAVANAQITVIAAGSNPLDLLVIGNNDTIPITIPNTGTVVNLVVFGNYDTSTIAVTAAGPTERVNLYEVGLHDTTTLTGGVAGTTVLGLIWGSSDTVTGPTTAESNGNTKVFVYFSGFTATTTACPNGNIATSDTVTGSSTAGTYTANWNVTSPFTPAVPADWTPKSQVVSPIAGACPFFSASSIPFNLAQATAGFDVHLSNTYIPSADVAFDQGAVVFAQDGGTPEMVDGPALSATLNGLAYTSLSIWFPVFVGSLPTDSGLSTTSFAARLISVTTIALTTASSLGVQNNTNIVITVQTPFAAAWENWLVNSPNFPNSDFTCLPATGPACNGPWASGGPMGTVTLTIPTTTQLDTLTIQVATFSVGLV